MTESVHLHSSRTSATDTRPVDTDTSALDTRVAGEHETPRTRTVLITAVAAVAVLVLLLPATPLVAVVLIAAVSLGVVAALVRRAEDRRTTGETLARLTAKGYLVLADRTAPALTGTIGHLVIGPGGVFVIETRNHTGRVRIRGDQLIVRRRSHSVVSRLRAQVAAVATTLEPVLDGTGVSVVPLICMRHAELPLMHRSVAGIPLLRESQLERRISRSAQVLDGLTVTRLGQLAEQTMPASARRRPSASTDDRVRPVDPLDSRVWSPEPVAYASEPGSVSTTLAFPSTQG